MKTVCARSPSTPKPGSYSITSRTVVPPVPSRLSAENSWRCSNRLNGPFFCMSAKWWFHSNSVIKAIHRARKGRNGRGRKEVTISEPTPASESRFETAGCSEGMFGGTSLSATTSENSVDWHRYPLLELNAVDHGLTLPNSTSTATLKTRKSQGRTIRETMGTESRL
jgi:hypothetical protein